MAAKRPSHVLGSALVDAGNSVLCKLLDYEREIDALQVLVREARDSLAFVRSWSTHAPFTDLTPPEPPYADIAASFWAWAEGWDCDLELRIDAALTGPPEAQAGEGT